MSAKLNAGQYPDRYAFRDDFKLVIQNAITYNVAGLVVELAQKLDAVFNKQWDRIEATLRAMEAPGGASKSSKHARPATDEVKPAHGVTADPASYQPPAHEPTQVAASLPPPRASAQLFERRPAPPSPASEQSHPQPAVPARATFLFKQREPVLISAPQPAPPPASSNPTNAAFDAFNPFAPSPIPVSAPPTAPTLAEPSAPGPGASPLAHVPNETLQAPSESPFTTSATTSANVDTALAHPDASMQAQVAAATPAPVAPAPLQSAPLGLSFKIKAPVRPVEPTPPPAQTSLSSDVSPAPPTPVDAKPSGFKITFGGGTAVQPPAVKPLKAPKASHSTTTSEHGDDGSWDGRGSSHKMSREGSNQLPHKKKKKDKDREKVKKEVSYAEPDDDDEAFHRPALPAPALSLVPPRPEILDQPPLPHPTRWFNPNDSVDPKKVRAVVNKISGMREAFWFLQPVDPIMLPTYVSKVRLHFHREGLSPFVHRYYDEIARPMDLQTLTRKLETGQYSNYGQVFDDFDLIVANCKQFNTPNTEPIWHVLIIDRAWRSEWEKASKLSYNVKRSLLSLLKSLMKEGA